MKRLLLLLAALALPAAGARADSASTSYVTVVAQDATIEVEWSLALRDLDDVVGLNSDGDGRITWGEVRAAAGRIAAYALPRLRLSASGAGCVPGDVALLADDIAGISYAVLRYTARCPVPVEQLDIAYAALFEFDPRHRGLLGVTLAGTQHAAVLSPAQRTARFGAAADAGMVVRQFFAAGVAHLLGGADHLLFIVMLLLPAFLRPDPARGTLHRVGAAARLLTAFTVAHGLALTLAVLDIVAVPPGIAEPAIALTILATALDNIRPFLPLRHDAIAFGFGLIHGLSVAGGLGPLHLPPALLALALVSFNLGLEAAQLLITALVAPLGCALRATRPASRRVLPTVSAAAAVIALLWFEQRTDAALHHAQPGLAASRAGAMPADHPPKPQG